MLTLWSTDVFLLHLKSKMQRKSSSSSGGGGGGGSSSSSSSSSSNNTNNEARATDASQRSVSQPTMNCSSAPASHTYAAMAGSEGPWHKPKYLSKRDRRDKKRGLTSNYVPLNSSNKTSRLSGASQTLTGAKPVQTVPMYLENISRGQTDVDSDIARRVRAFARGKGLRVIAAHVVRNRRSDDVVGCRLTIPETMATVVTSAGYWPDGIRCRPWEKKTRNFKPKRNVDSKNIDANPCEDLEYSLISSGGLASAPPSHRESSASEKQRAEMDRIKETHDWYDIDYDNDQVRYNDTDYGYTRGDIHVDEECE